MQAPRECLLVQHTGFRLGVWSFYYLHCMSMSSPHEIETKAVVRLSAIRQIRSGDVTTMPKRNHQSRRPATGYLALPLDTSGITTIGSADMSGRVLSSEFPPPDTCTGTGYRCIDGKVLKGLKGVKR